MGEVASAIAAPLLGGLPLLGAGGLTKNLFKSPSVPKTPDSISTNTSAVQQAAAEAAQRRARARGQQSTILSQLTQATGGAAPRETIGS